jgi:1,4-dihydroxy-2-naphthoate polyprenyltransferase
MLAARPKTLPAAAVPVLLGTAVAASLGGLVDAGVFVGTLVAALLIQIGTNFANDYSDFVRGADHEERLGPLRVTQSGLLSQRAIRRGIVIAFGLALFVGVYLAWVGGWPIVVIGLLSIVCGLAYTGGPWPFGYHGLGDLFVFIFFGVIAVTGTAYLQTGSWSGLAFAASAPIGLLTTNILVVNNLRDIPTDRVAGKITLAIRIGEHATRWQYAAFTMLAYLTPALIAFGRPRGGWLLLPWLSMPFAAALTRRVLNGTAGRELNLVLDRTGQLLLVYGILFAIGFLVVAGR